jgi:hypothetical protein
VSVEIQSVRHELHAVPWLAAAKTAIDLQRNISVLVRHVNSHGVIVKQGLYDTQRGAAFASQMSEDWGKIPHEM